MKTNEIKRPENSQCSCVVKFHHRFLLVHNTVFAHVLSILIKIQSEQQFEITYKQLKSETEEVADEFTNSFYFPWIKFL